MRPSLEKRRELPQETPELEMPGHGFCRRSDYIWYKSRNHAGGVRRHDACWRVLENDTVLRVASKTRRRRQEYVRVGFTSRRFVSRVETTGGGNLERGRQGG
jgi:hypothetical protein